LWLYICPEPDVGELDGVQVRANFFSKKSEV